MPPYSSVARPPRQIDRLQSAPVFVDVDGVRFGLSRVARRRRVAGLLCEAPPGIPIPHYALRRRIRAMLAGAYAGGDLTIFTDSARSAEVWSWTVGGGHGPIQALERLRQTDDTDLTWEAIDDSRRADRPSAHLAAQSQVIESTVARTVLR